MMRSSPLLRSMLVLNARAFGFLNAPLVGAARRGFRGGAAAPTLGLSRRGGALHGARSASDFTTSELKRLLGERGIDFRDCLEKRELVERLQDLPDEDEQLQSLEQNFPSVSAALLQLLILGINDLNTSLAWSGSELV